MIIRSSLLLGGIIGLFAFCQKPETSIGYEFETTPVWADEFEERGLPDSNKWGYEVGGNGWGNNELQFYTDKRSENARVEGGKLIIEARKEDFQEKNYTSARLTTKGKADWTYGRFVIRAKLPKGRGTWPAIWMLASQQLYGSAYWPDNGEIDIMEHVGYDPGVVHATVHTKAFNHIAGTQRGDTLTITDAMTNFHDYVLEWTPDYIRAFVDTTQYFEFRNTQKGWQEWPYDKPEYLLLNIAVGGNWGGQKGVDDTIFPQRMEIEYVRVYRLKE
ncbi:MAG: glycoside hydrolase family 16 protein [Siphonobacter sp.]